MKTLTSGSSSSLKFHVQVRQRRNRPTANLSPIPTPSIVDLTCPPARNCPSHLIDFMKNQFGKFSLHRLWVDEKGSARDLRPSNVTGQMDQLPLSPRHSTPLSAESQLRLMFKGSYRCQHVVGDFWVFTRCSRRFVKYSGHTSAQEQ